MSTKAVVYLRISLDQTGERLAVERQREDCQQIAAERGWDVVETYVDNSVSASKRTVRRPAYDRMVDDFKAGRFDALVCYDLDRLTRQPRQLEDWIEAAEERGLKLVTANGEADLTTDAGRLFARIKASVARAEVERKSARQTRAALQRADRGKVPAGVRLTGYAVDGALVADEAAVVLDVFERFAAGESLKGLAAVLGASGVPTRRGGAWHPSTVRTILTNARYAGRAVYRGVETGKAGAWEPIVGEGLFDVVQARLGDPRRITNREGTDRKHLGSGLYLCGICGGRLRTNGTRYWCPVGGHVLRSLPRVDEFVVAVIRARLALPDAARLVSPVDDAAIAQIDAQARDLRARLATIESDYDGGLIDGRRFAVASDKAQAELRKLEADRSRLLVGSAAGALLAASDPVVAFDAATLSTRRALLDALATVTLLPSPRGRKGLDPETVRIGWK